MNCTNCLKKMNKIRTNQPCLRRGKGFVLGINRLIIKYLNLVLKRNDCFLSIIHVKIISILHIMSISSSQLNQTQLEILKFFSRDLSETDLLDLKRIIVRFLAEKATKIIDEKGLSNEDIDKIAHTHLRTPYN